MVRPPAVSIHHQQINGKTRSCRLLQSPKSPYMCDSATTATSWQTVHRHRQNIPRVYHIYTRTLFLRSLSYRLDDYRIDWVNTSLDFERLAIFAEIAGLMEYRQDFFRDEFEVSQNVYPVVLFVLCGLVGGEGFCCTRQEERVLNIRHVGGSDGKSECLPTPFRCLGHIFCHAVFRRHSSSMIVRTHAPIPALHL